MFNRFPHLAVLAIYITALLPIPLGIGSASIFDLFLPFLVIYFVIALSNSKHTAVIVLLYVFSSALLFVKSFDVSILLNILGWLARFALFFSPILVISLFRKIKRPNLLANLSTYNSYYIVSFLFLALSFYSFFHYIGFLSPRYWGLGFPLYSTGLDPHVFGPSLSLIVVFNFYSIFSNISRTPLPHTMSIIILTSMLFLFSAISASRGVFAIYVAAMLFALFTTLLKACNTLRISRRILLSSVVILVFFLSSYFIYNISVSSDTSSSFTSDSSLQRVFSKLSRLDSLGSLFSDPSADASRGQKVLDLFTLLSNPNNWLIGSPGFKPVYDSGFLLLYQNFGLLIVGALYLCYFFSIFKHCLTYPLASCLVFCALFHFTVASETLLIPRFNLLLVYLVFSSCCLDMSCTDADRLPCTAAPSLSTHST
jgi:hypothetical protein